MPRIPSKSGLYDDLLILKSCLQFGFWLYFGLCFIASLSLLTAFGIAIISGSVYFAFRRYSLPKGNAEFESEILGSDIFEVESKSPGTIQEEESKEYILKVVAHRFAGLDAPENSLEALEACHKAGFVAVEFDLALTLDKVPVLFHDVTIDRMTNGSGKISDQTWDTLSKYDISVNHPFKEKYQGSKVPKFEDVIKKCLELDMRLFIDIKDADQEIVNAVCEAFDNHPNLYKRAVVSSFNPIVIYQIRERRPGIVGCMAWRPDYFACTAYTPESSSRAKDARDQNILKHTFNRILDLVFSWFFFNFMYKFCGLSAVLIHKDAITKESVTWWRDRGIRCIAWTVNLPSEKVHISKNLKIAYLTDTALNSQTIL